MHKYLCKAPFPQLSELLKCLTGAAPLWGKEGYLKTPHEEHVKTARKNDNVAHALTDKTTETAQL